MTKTQIIVIGGGLVGLTTAYSLRKRGYEVTVLEALEVGSGASRGNSGQYVSQGAVPLAAPGIVKEGIGLMFKPTSAFFVNPLSIPKLAPFLLRTAANANTNKYWDSIGKMDLINANSVAALDAMRKDGIGSLMSETPFLYVYQSRAAAEASRAEAEELSRRGIGEPPSELLGRSELIGREPFLGEAPQFGFFHPGDRWGNPSVFIDQLAGWLERNGVAIMRNSPVSAIREVNGHVEVLTGDRAYLAEKVVLSAGVWSKELARALKVKVPLEPGKGYSFSVPVAAEPKQITMFGGARVAALPLGGGKVRLSGTMEFDHNADRPTWSRIDLIKTAATPFMGQADWSGVDEQWMGARPMTADGLPFIGQIPGTKNVFINAGHNMLGFSMGPASGEFLADLLEDATLAHENPFSLARL